ncbi:hypothetical protein [Marinobacter sp. SS21]|uniref:hypothetical protein n=1 Tax=Marinobacter sp. SS21 TaxID=2979460 RepID=UPI002330727C|nr:hypothetical protein [Marinobacter sp. SS21]MDC0663269.1 hypothetical protein [Marinobacter sp. SS21]
MMNRPLLNLVAAMTLATMLSGCASYYSHYAMFPAANSSGESRMVRLSWQSAEYPGWWLRDNQATSIRVETQCSERQWRLTEAESADQGGCGPGIRACGQEGLDVLAESGQPATKDSVCLALSSGPSNSRIATLDRNLELTVHCRPAEVSRQSGGESVGMDYIRPSAVPYVVAVKKAPRGSLAAKLPEFDDAVCD